MAKRRLNQQQRRRIAEQQTQRRTKMAEDSDNLGPAQTGIVVAHFGQTLDVEAANGERYRCYARQNLGALVTGDRVIWRAEHGDAQRGVIIALEPRNNLLQRPDPYKITKPIAANIDQVFVVAAVVPEPVPYFIDKYLVAAEHCGLPVCVLLNKSDLVEDKQGLSILKARYECIGYPVVECSAVTAYGFDSLCRQLHNKTSIFLGQSGVGKSSLLNTLLGDAVAAIGEISDANRKGRHTTTTARLYHLSDNGDIIDSPGIREYGLQHLTAQQVAQGFVEFRPYLGQCRFRDCAHRQEPGCALSAAVDAGVIDRSRMESFQRVIDQDLLQS